MYRGQVYNASGWQSPQASASRETSRRLDRRIRQNMGILDRSRHSNQSNSIRMKRTQNSGDRMQHSRDREPNSQQTSGIISMRRVPRRMGSVLSLSRKRQPFERNRIQAAGSRSGKNIVENLYMLTNNVPQYSDRRHHYQYDTQPNEQRYNSKQGRQRYEPQQSYNRQQQIQRYPQRSPNNYHDRSQERFREQPYRSSRNQTPTRTSVLRSRRSKEANVDERPNISRDRHYKHVGSSRDIQRPPGDTQIRKLQQKYMENIYELNSPKGRRGQNKGNREKPERGNRVYDQHYRDRQKQPYQRREKQYGQVQQMSSPRTHNDNNRHRKQPDRRPYPDERDRRYPAERDRRPYQDRDYYNRDDRRYPDKVDPRFDHRYREDFYDQAQYEREINRNHPGYRGYECREYRDKDSRKKDPKIYSNNSAKNNPYYQDQIPSTTVGVKTLPQFSRYDSISDAPIHSIGSQKDTSRQNMVQQLPAKHSVKLDRPKGRPARGAKRQQNRPSEESNIEDRLQKNHIKLQERPPQKWDNNKRKVLQDPVSPGKLPTGSMFLPVESKRYEPREETELTLQKIIVHLQNLNLIADYTKDFKKMYENVQPWQVLIFLTYKKFYIQRTKATNALKTTASKNSSELSDNLEVKQNPFTLPYSKISEDQLSKFKETKECFALMIELQSQNTKIRNALRGLYNLYIEKSGEYVNMLDCDNFSQEIYKLMLEELDGISENLQDVELVTPTRIRMGKIIKVGLLIAFLDGKYVRNFPQILIHEDMIKIGKRQTLREDSLSHLFIEEFKRVLS